MPVGFLTEEQERRYGRYAGDPSSEQLARYFFRDDADRAFIDRHRGAHMRLGCAMQLGTVRFLGTFLDDPTDVPRLVVRCMADQLGLAVDGHMEAYRASGWRRQHPAEIRQTYGYRTFAEPGVRFRLARSRAGSTPCAGRERSARACCSTGPRPGSSRARCCCPGRPRSNGWSPACGREPRSARGAC